MEAPVVDPLAPEDPGETEDQPEDQPEAMAPPVVAVVVVHDAGPWFEEALASLAGQDYPALSVLVVDADSTEDPTPRVARVLPAAFVRRLDHNPGYGPASNAALDAVEGATFLLFLHDDVAMAPDACRLMVEEAYRSNAGVVGPKLVQWDDPRRLLQVGLAADKTGVPISAVEPGELDQEQHDAVRDVFIVPGACMLVRADLFTALGGFDPLIPLLGEDLDLCWRAQVAGARVLVVPQAVGRHLEALGTRYPDTPRRRLQARHRLRTTLTAYGPFHLFRVLPQAALLSVVEAVYSLFAGRLMHAREVMGAWTWNADRFADLRRRRQAVKRIRQVPDSEVRRLQVGGSARFGAYLRGQIGRGDDRLRSLATASRDFAGAVRAGRARTGLVVWAAIVFVLLIGSRVLLLDGPPAIGDLPAFPDQPGDLFSTWAAGWRAVGLGSESQAPTGLAMLGVGGVLTLGQLGLLRTLCVVVLLPVGVLGVWRMARSLGSSRARLVAAVVYASIPVPYNAIATGRWGGLVAWAAMPWVLGRLFLASNAPPFASPVRPLGRDVLALGVVVALAAAFVPSMVLAVAVAAVALAASGLAFGRRRSRVLIVAAGALAVAIVLLLPWAFDFVASGREWAAFGGVPGREVRSLAEMLRFETGPFGTAPLGWVFLVPAALPLLVGRDWRFEWAVRAWVLAVAAWALAWVGSQGWWDYPFGPPEVLLAVAAAALALAAALGLVAFEVDLPGYRFGWRQVAWVSSVIAVIVGTLPVLAAVPNGRWRAPPEGFDRVLGFMAEDADAGAFRVLWVGDPEVLPGGSWALSDGTAFTLSDDGLPTVDNRWPGSSDGATELVADALGTASRGDVSRLGRLLAPMGIRYIVLPSANAPRGGVRRPIPRDLATSLGEQLDLVARSVDPRLLVFENQSWVPARAQLPAGTVPEADADDYFATASETDLSAATPVLLDGIAHDGWTGEVATGDVYLAAGSPRWELEVGDEHAERRDAFGWASAFAVTSGGDATLEFRTSPIRWLLLVAEGVLWAAVIVVLARGRPRRGATPEPGP